MCERKKGRARFTQSGIDLMRFKYTNGKTQQSIADDFGTTQSHISEIMTRKRWK